MILLFTNSSSRFLQKSKICFRQSKASIFSTQIKKDQKIGSDGLNNPHQSENPNEEHYEDAVNEKLYPEHIPTSCFQKALLTVGSSLGAILDPYRDDLVAVLGETTGAIAARRIRSKMLASSEGSQILKEQPRISSETLNLGYLRSLPEDSFGQAYINFLDVNGVSPDTRQPVHFVDDAELAYIIQRYREVHDLVHTLLGMPTNMLGEVAVKWVEAIQTGLPMCAAGAVVGPIRFKTKQRKKYLKSYLPWALECGFSAKFLMNVYFEKRWEQSLRSLRTELNIKEPPT